MSAMPVLYTTQVNAWRELLATERRQQARHGRPFGSAHQNILGQPSRAMSSGAGGSGCYGRRSEHLSPDVTVAALMGAGPPSINYTSTAAAAMRDVSPTWRRSPPRTLSQATIEWTKAHRATAAEGPSWQGAPPARPWTPAKGHGTPSWTKDASHLLYPPLPGTEAKNLHHLARAPWGSLSGARVGLF